MEGWVVVHPEGKIYSCKNCHTHLALVQDIFSKAFQRNGKKAYLFSEVVNVSAGESEDRMMLSGIHTVADISCVGCGTIVGWKYDTAPEESLKYKEGKSALQRDKIMARSTC